MKIVKRAAFLLVLVLVPVLILSPIEAQAGEPAPERIVYASNRGGNTDIWTVAGDGTGARRLTSDPAQDIQPDVSPDSSRIAFVRGAGVGSVPSVGDIWVMDADGTTARPLVANPGAAEYRPDFSPDGKRLLFTRHTDGLGLAQELWVARADGTAPKRLLTNATYGQWSPDGTKIAYVADPADSGQVAVAEADGSDPRTLTDTGTNVAPQWSPDGRRLVFTSFRNGKGEIWVMNADGSDEHVVAASAGKEGFATWSPDGARIAWASTRHTSCPKDLSDLCPQRIHTARLDGDDVRAVSDGLTDSFPAYFPA